MISHRILAVLAAALLALAPHAARAQTADSLARRGVGRGAQWLNVLADTAQGTAMYVDTAMLRRTPEGMRVGLRIEYAKPLELNDGTPYYGAEFHEIVDCEGNRSRDLDVSPLNADGKPFESLPYPHQEWKPFAEHPFLDVLGRPLCLRIAAIMMTGN
jgi:hypothetical protein